MSSKKGHKVILTDYEWPNLEIERQVLGKAGINFVPTHCSTEEEVIEVAQDADGVIVEYAPITARVIEKLRRCQIISLNAAGYDNVDLKAATEAGVLVVNCPAYCYEEVADHTMALLLAMARGIDKFAILVKKGIWDFKSAGQLYRVHDQRLGLVGFGLNARAVAKRAKAFGLKVLAYDPYTNEEVFEREQVERVDFEDLLRQSDFVSLHVPKTSETVNLISEREFSLMKSSAFLINTSRGGVVDEKALVEALKHQAIRGAALDVLATEPPDLDNPVLAMDNVLVTPHVAFYSETAMEEVRIRAAQAVVDVLEGRLPTSVVNRDVLRGKQLRAKIVQPLSKEV
ncbi:MAG: C-terminal binding protein [Deltaproteobacteria bacterium]|nr:C-terminal binding protein [Deltaproteobacteria bacterium]